MPAKHFQYFNGGTSPPCPLPPLPTGLATADDAKYCYRVSSRIRSIDH